jgi:acetyltransferase-like isoleucine patch superfamily enzyme
VPVVIEDNVWLGEDVVVLPNVNQYNRCKLSSDKINTQKSVSAGDPARIIREFD